MLRSTIDDVSAHATLAIVLLVSYEWQTERCCWSHNVMMWSNVKIRVAIPMGSRPSHNCSNLCSSFGMTFPGGQSGSTMQKAEAKELKHRRKLGHARIPELWKISQSRKSDGVSSKQALIVRDLIKLQVKLNASTLACGLTVPCFILMPFHPWGYCCL